MRVAISASTGLIGSALAQTLHADGAEVIRLVRRQPAGSQEIYWDPNAADGRLSPAALDDFDAVVHLSGAPVAARRWTTARKELLRDSRIGSTEVLARALRSSASPPAVFAVASAIGWYGDTGEDSVDETAPPGQGFLATLVRDWEAAAEPAAAAGIRVVYLRSGFVLGTGGGLLPRLLVPFRLGLGARIGSGRQYLSWITLGDHIRAVRYLLDRHDLAGPVNLTSPHPVTNADFTKALAAAVHRPAVLRVPAGPLRLALGEVSGDLLGSCRAVPGRLTQSGFGFLHPTIGPAITAAIGARSPG